MAVLLLAGAGCLAPVPAECREADCAREPASLLPAVGLVDEAQLQGCVGGFGNAQAAWDIVRAAVPEDFELDGLTAASALILVQALDCDRIVTNVTVYSDVSFVRVAAYVTPKNETWRSPGTHYYVLDVLVSDDRLARQLEPRLPTTGASVSFEPTALGDVRLESWSAAAPDCSLDLNLRRSGEPEDARHAVFHSWAGSFPYWRVEEKQSHRFEGGSHPHFVAASGGCASAAALGPSSPYTARPYLVESVWSLSSQAFDGTWRSQA